MSLLSSEKHISAMSVQSLKKKTVKGTLWSAVDNMLQCLVAFIVSIILARLISPDEYGLIGIVMIFTTVCTAVINGGFSTALIRKKEPVADDFNTTFIVNLCASIVIYLLLFFSAPLIAHFFGREELISLMRVASATLVIGALAIVQQVRLIRSIDFKTQTKISLSAGLCSGALGIGMALCDFGVWALVAQSLSAQVIRTSMLYFYNRWVPALRFSSDSFNELFGFGWKMMVSSILESLWTQMNQAVVAKYYAPATLGQYTRSKQFAQLFSNNLYSVIQRVTFPVLSSIQDEKERLVVAFRKIVRVSMFVTFALMFAVAAVAEPLLYCLIGPQWHEAATYLPVICMVGALYPLHALNLNMLQVQGRSDLFLSLEIIKKILGIAPLVIGALMGVLPLLYATLAVSMISFFLNSYFPGKMMHYSPCKQLCDITPSFLVAATMAISVYFLKFLPLSYWIVLPVQIVSGAALFFTLCIVFRIEEYHELKTLAMPYIHKVLRKHAD